MPFTFDILHPGLLTLTTFQQGPAGASFIYVDYVAGVALGGHRAVVLDASEQAVYADKDTLTDRDKVIGITTGASIMGATAQIQTAGELTEPSWSWTAGDTIYLGTNGLLSNAAPVTGFVLKIGFAISPTKIFISIKQPIILT